MNHSRDKKRRSIACQVERLDDRTLLSLAIIAPITPIAIPPQISPASSPTNPAFIVRFATGVHNLNRQFMNKAQSLSTELVNRTNIFDARLSSLVNRDQALEVKALATTGQPSRINLSSIDTTFTNQFNRFQNTFNNQLTRFQTTLQNQMNNLSQQFIARDAQASIPTSAFQTNFQAATSQFTSGIRNALSSVNTAFQTGLNSLNGVFSNPTSLVNSTGLGTSTGGTTGVGLTGAGTSSLGTTGIVTPGTGTTTIGILPSQTEVFNNAFTQAFSSFDSAISGITTTLQQDFGSFSTQFSTNNSTLFSSLNSNPFGSFPTTTIGFSQGNFPLTGSSGTPTTPIGTTTPTLPGDTGLTGTGTGTATGTGTGTGTGTTGSGGGGSLGGGGGSSGGSGSGGSL